MDNQNDPNSSNNTSSPAPAFGSPTSPLPDFSNPAAPAPTPDPLTSVPSSAAPDWSLPSQPSPTFTPPTPNPWPTAPAPPQSTPQFSSPAAAPSTPEPVSSTPASDPNSMWANPLQPATSTDNWSTQTQLPQSPTPTPVPDLNNTGQTPPWTPPAQTPPPQETPAPLQTDIPTPPAQPEPTPTFTPPPPAGNENNQAAGGSLSSLDNPWETPAQPPSIAGLNPATQPSWMTTSGNPTENQTPNTPPIPTDSTPTDLSHLITNNDSSQQAPHPAPETLVVPTSPAPEIPTMSNEGHKGIPHWLIGLGIGILILVGGTSAYFILGIGQPAKTTTSLPATVAKPPEVKAPLPITTPIPVQTTQPTATGSSSFGELEGAAASPQASSAASLLRQRQTQGR